MRTCTAEIERQPVNIHYLRGIRERVKSELGLMAQQLGLSAADEPFAAVYQTAAEHLFEIERLCCDGDIDPRAWVRACPEDEPCLPYSRSLRVGVYPVAANPLHWGHVLIGLRAMARLHLDKVVYVTAGRDSRKPGMAAADLRFIMARDLLKLFGCLFACSPLALASGCDGETNLFRFLRLNRQQPMDVYYIAGGDHCRRFYPGTDYPDTLAKLEMHRTARLFAYTPAMHSVSAAFIRRSGHGELADTDLSVHTLDSLPFDVSSTMIRAALAGAGPERDLALLPYSAWVDIRSMRLYAKPSAPPRHRELQRCDAALMAVA